MGLLTWGQRQEGDGWSGRLHVIDHSNTPVPRSFWTPCSSKGNCDTSASFTVPINWLRKLFFRVSQPWCLIETAAAI